MAKNGRKSGGRNGVVEQRSQFKGSGGHWVKRHSPSGKIMNVKADEKPFKGVRKEK